MHGEQQQLLGRGSDLLGSGVLVPASRLPGEDGPCLLGGAGMLLCRGRLCRLFSAWLNLLIAQFNYRSLSVTSHRRSELTAPQAAASWACLLLAFLVQSYMW